jgi:hypothetical protein
VAVRSINWFGGTTKAQPMKYLTIDCTKYLPSFGVVQDGRVFGTLQMLDWSELKDYAKWLGLAGGRGMLDSFEVALINCGMLYVWPVDADGDPKHDECTALEIRHYDTGSRIAWEAKLKCDLCCGQGHHNLHSEPVEEEDLCMACDGDGYRTGEEFETDMDGNELPPNVELTGRPLGAGKRDDL